MRYSEPIMKCDHAEGGCDANDRDYYEQCADSVNGVKITISTRAPGWFSTMDADYCPEHNPRRREGE